MEKVFFRVPDKKYREIAIGPLAGAPIRMKKALNIITPMFEPIPAPEETDWLAENDEDGQTYEGYLSQQFNNVNEKRKVIYIQPIEKKIDKSFLDKLKQFTEAYYYGLEVRIRKVIDLDQLKVDSRINDSHGKIQVNASQILQKLETKLPADAYCMIAVCLTDLYHREDWNFVFGVASLKKRIGVFSFFRYFDPDDESLTFWRSCKVMVHEIGHMFHIRHCVYFNCIMNGSNTLEENDKKPMEMCPVCIRKLQHNITFEMVDRYKQLADACLELGGEFTKLACWYGNIEKKILEAYGSHYKTRSSQRLEDLNKKKIK